MSTPVSLLAPMAGAERKTVPGVQLDIVRTGAARVKRVVYAQGSAGPPI